MAGPQCCSNPPKLSSCYGEGHVEQFGGLVTYITGSPASIYGILLISDVFGYEAPKLRKLADKIAAAGFYVVIPDFFYGDPFSYENAEKPLPVWIKFHEAEKGFEDAKPVIAALKSLGMCAIGAAGFCWGAKVVVQLAKSDNYIQAGAMLHPSFVTVDEMKEVKVPIAIMGAEVDKYCPPELLKQFEEVLSSKPQVNSFVKLYPGTEHGWTTRYSDEDEFAIKSSEESHQDMLAWFTKHVN
ncbi:endo-1,3;1,4-beta-D-glucanase-like isoform X2 [Actinidia eriantha]|uniref:endo-1,3;1,4-beta-D-glucanase-like isoform X2 n=1 Tax=Actinidia eriantha TaxID=165200 RepID=UPI002585CBF2|nr:endo-1,3;1,4-beta-D-glucanase-like isoform X2 [Actinidia eriantha]